MSKEACVGGRLGAESVCVQACLLTIECLGMQRPVGPVEERIVPENAPQQLHQQRGPGRGGRRGRNVASLVRAVQTQHTNDDADDDARVGTHTCRKQSSKLGAKRRVARRYKRS